MHRSKIYTFIIAVTIISLFAGCSVLEPSLDTTPGSTPPVSETPVNTEPSAPQLVALEIGSTTDSSDGGIHADEYLPWTTSGSGSSMDLTAPQNMTITVNGETYSGEYLRSGTILYSADQYYCYSGEHVTFKVLPETNEIVTFVSLCKKGNLTENECKKIATEYASDYINLAEYEMTHSYVDDLHMYGYQKIINGVKTRNFLAVGVDTTGRICSFMQGMLDSFTNSKAESAALSQSEEITRITNADIESLIAAKVSKIYPDIEFDELEWTELLLELEDGSVGLLCNVSAVTFTPVDDGYHSYSRHVQLLIKEGDSL